MHFLRFSFLLLALLSSTSVFAVTEQEIKRYLPGQWNVNSKIDVISAVGTSTFSPDGTVVYDVKLTGPGVDVTMLVKATWSVSGTKLVTTITETSVPEMMPVGTVETDTVLAISDTVFTYVDDEGMQATETREPSAKF